MYKECRRRGKGKTEYSQYFVATTMESRDQIANLIDRFGEPEAWGETLLFGYFCV